MKRQNTRNTLAVTNGPVGINDRTLEAGQRRTRPIRLDLDPGAHARASAGRRGMAQGVEIEA
ncbi:MAG: hypothetical protein WCD37_16255, partial [Chloroflexia bacterium]